MKATLRTLSLSLVVLLSVGWKCNPNNQPPPPPPEPDAGASTTCTDPCQGDLVLFGPETFTRTCGQPNEFTRTLSLPDAMDVCVIANNDHNASAVVRIDGDKVLRQSDFNHNVTRVTHSSSLSVGDHALTIRLTSMPGSSITLEVRACDPTPPAHPPCSVVATSWCESKGWAVESVGPGSLVCVAPGFNGGDSCLGCSQYNVVVWDDGGGDPLCSASYSTQDGNFYGGHTPCACADNLMVCGTWDMGGCIPD